MMTPYIPPNGMRLMGALLNPTVENASFPPALLDWGAVIPGRCGAAWQRDKLEFQERLFDEVAVSMFWLWGTKWMETLFGQLQKTIPALKNVRADVGMGIFNGDSLIKNGLAPIERFSKNHRQAMTMQGVRSGKTLLSMVSNFLIIALLIPRLNQMKTAWLIKKFYKTPANKTKPQDLRLGQNTALVQQATHAQQAFGYLNTNHAAVSNHVANTRFGSNTLQKAFKALEIIKSSDYGYILTGDGAMLAGRSYSAFTRPDVSRRDTVGEVREILWRDAVSSYLYLWGIPHITRLASALIKPFWPSETSLEPMVGQMMLHRLSPVLQGLKAPLKRVQLNQWWHGKPINQSVLDQWTEALSHVHQPNIFWHNLQVDIANTLGEQTWQHIKPILIQTAPHNLSAHSLGSWLHSVTDHKALGPDVVRSIKRAFGQSVGMPVSEVITRLLPKVTRADQAAVKQRMHQMAVTQTQQQLADSWQFALQRLDQDIPLTSLGFQGKGSVQSLALALDAKAITPANQLAAEFHNLPDLFSALSRKAPEFGPLFDHMAQQARQLLTNPVLRQVEKLPEWLPNPLTYTLTGAAKHDPQLVKQAMSLVGIAPEDFRQEVNPTKLKKLITNMDAFFNHMVANLPDTALTSGEAALTQLNSLAKTRNMWPRYVTLLTGVLSSMVSLGIIVPRIQYWITQKTTGRNEQPALAALRQRYGISQ